MSDKELRRQKTVSLGIKSFKEDIVDYKNGHKLEFFLIQMPFDYMRFCNPSFLYPLNLV